MNRHGTDFYFVVQLNTDTGKRKQGKLFLSVNRGDGTISVVKSKTAATPIPTRGLAQVVSDYFWEHNWEHNKEKFNLQSREVVYVKARNKKQVEI